MTSAPSPKERMRLLLAEQALFGLDAASTAELDQLIVEHPDENVGDFDRIVFGLELSAASRCALKLPDELAQKILSQAQAGSASALPKRDVAVRLPDGVMQSRHVSYSGWFVAAACLLLAAVGWLRPIGKEFKVASVSPSQARQQLIQASRETVVRPWKVQQDPAASEASGDVVWNESRQEGYMRFRRLAANDPTIEQYQLWIFDESQDAATPIDGGVFDIPAGQEEVVIPIQPKLKVSGATMFAITVEKPGGVVVSKRERLPLLAQVAADRESAESSFHGSRQTRLYGAVFIPESMTMRSDLNLRRH